MARLVRLSKGKLGPESIGVAIDPDDFDKESSLEPGKTWHELGYRLANYDDDGTPYEHPRESRRSAPREADEKK